MCADTFYKYLVRNLEARATYSRCLILAGHWKRSRDVNEAVDRPRHRHRMPITLRLSGFPRPKYRSCQISRCRGRNRLRSIAIVARRRRHFAVLLLCCPKANGTVCVIIKRHKGRSEVKRLLTIAEDSRLIAYTTREEWPYLSLSLFLLS